MNNVIVVLLKYTNIFNERSPIFRKGLHSVVETTQHLDYCKIVVVDNGEDLDEDFCLDQMHKNNIHAYVRLPNLGLGGGRNTGLDVGMHLFKNDVKFVVFVDDDIIFEKGWVEECVEILNKYPEEKIIATPVHTPCHMRKRFLKGELPDGHKLNKRSGSNCLFFRIKDYNVLGRFSEKLEVGPCGSKFTTYYNKQKFLGALTYKPMAVTNMENIRHSYPGDRDRIVTNLLKISNINPKVGVQIGMYSVKCNGISNYGEVSAYLLYNFSDLFLFCIDPSCKRKKPAILERLYKNRFEFEAKKSIEAAEFIENHSSFKKNNGLDFIYIANPDPDLSELKFWKSKVKSGGVLIGRYLKSCDKNLRELVEDFNLRASSKFPVWWAFKR